MPLSPESSLLLGKDPFLSEMSLCGWNPCHSESAVHAHALWDLHCGLEPCPRSVVLSASWISLPWAAHLVCKVDFPCLPLLCQVSRASLVLQLMLRVRACLFLDTFLCAVLAILLLSVNPMGEKHFIAVLICIFLIMRLDIFLIELLPPWAY